MEYNEGDYVLYEDGDGELEVSCIYGICEALGIWWYIIKGDYMHESNVLCKVNKDDTIETVKQKHPEYFV